MQMATDFGYHVSFWQSIEAGRKMSLQTMLRVANTFDLTIEELLQACRASSAVKGLALAPTATNREHPLEDE
jgi:hypothetical protein